MKYYLAAAIGAAALACIGVGSALSDKSINSDPAAHNIHQNKVSVSEPKVDPCNPRTAKCSQAPTEEFKYNFQ